MASVTLREIAATEDILAESGLSADDMWNALVYHQRPGIMQLAWYTAWLQFRASHGLSMNLRECPPTLSQVEPHGQRPELLLRVCRELGYTVDMVVQAAQNLILDSARLDTAAITAGCDPSHHEYSHWDTHS